MIAKPPDMHLPSYVIVLAAFGVWALRGQNAIPVTVVRLALRVLELDLDPKTGFRFPVLQSIADELDELAKAK